MSKKSPYTPDYVIDRIMKPVEDVGEKIVKITMNPIDFADFRKFGRDVLDIETYVTTVVSGHMANMFGIQLHVKKHVNPGYFDLETIKEEKFLKREYCSLHGINFKGSHCNNINCIIQYIHES